tara:strand:+ start:581 stop:757 length:177 start_codon:yes stop_codon:yes gene_type:complete
MMAVLYTEEQLQEAYDLDRTERVKLGYQFSTLEEYRPIYERILSSIYENALMQESIDS